MADNFAYTYQDVRIYPYPNPAITELLVSSRMRAIVSEYTMKIEATYRAGLLPRTSPRKSGPNLIDTVKVFVGIGGYKNDRIVGEVSVGDGTTNPYGGADEFGRNKYAPYEGSHGLSNALYTHLPFRA